MSIGGFSEDNGASVSVSVDSPVYNVELYKRPLIEKLLSVPEYKERYLGYVNTLCEYFSKIESITSVLSSLISEDVKNDPTAFYTYEKFEECLKLTGSDLTQNTGNTVPGNGEIPSMPEGGEMPSMPEGMQPGN